jgi:hypothetical protein
VRVEPALAHPDLVGQAADREALDGGQASGGVDDQLIAPLAVGAGTSFYAFWWSTRLLPGKWPGLIWLSRCVLPNIHSRDIWPYTDHYGGIAAFKDETFTQRFSHQG